VSGKDFEPMKQSSKKLMKALAFGPGNGKTFVTVRGALKYRTAEASLLLSSNWVDGAMVVLAGGLKLRHSQWEPPENERRT
jgi:hypothetical protein